MLIINKEFQNGIGRWLMDDYKKAVGVICSVVPIVRKTAIKQPYYVQHE
jgi:hypothetical protein